ncbi:hypothetical protein [Vulgatibacter sp.]|uniref:hypothetical protein n=1 Tax=Vulgatibacter sp. TaxID=1971226 RepID=UPI003566CA5A
MRVTRWLVQAVLALVLGTTVAACATDDDPAGGGGAGGTGGVGGGGGTGGATEPAAINTDWNALPAEPQVVDGWSLGSCGDAPVLCATHPTHGDGKVEAMRFPLESMTDFKAKLDSDGAEAALQWAADDFLATFGADRAAGCPAGSEFTPEEPAALTVGGHPAVRIEFRVALEDGTGIEHVRSTMIYDGAAVHVIVASGLADENGCLERMGEFTVEGFADFLPLYDRIVAGSTLLDG